MLKFALIGKNIKHSKSKEVYEKLLGHKIHYDVLDVEEESGLPSLKELKDYNGVSITSPYKEFYLSNCVMTDFAKELNAINCLFFKDEKFFATNTDYLACQEIFKGLQSKFKNKEIIVLGSGPMSRVIKKVLNENKVFYKLLSRQAKNFESLRARSMENSLFIINCLSRKVSLPVELNSKDTVWDLNYLNSEILSSYREKPEYLDGEKLLFLQARFALSFWNIKDLLNS